MQKMGPRMEQELEDHLRRHSVSRLDYRPQRGKVWITCDDCGLVKSVCAGSKRCARCNRKRSPYSYGPTARNGKRQ